MSQLNVNILKNNSVFILIIKYLSKRTCKITFNSFNIKNQFFSYFFIINTRTVKSIELIDFRFFSFIQLPKNIPILCYFSRN